MKKVALIILLLSSMMKTVLYAAPEPRIEAIKVPFYVGQTVMACGRLAEVTHLEKIHFLNLDKAYHEQSLSIVIFADDYISFVRRFGDIDKLVGAKFCARGEIEDYRGRLQIIVKNPQFLRLMK